MADATIEQFLKFKVSKIKPQENSFWLHSGDIEFIITA